MLKASNEFVYQYCQHTFLIINHNNFCGLVTRNLIAVSEKSFKALVWDQLFSKLLAMFLSSGLWPAIHAAN